MEAKKLTTWLLIGVLGVLLSSCAMLPCGTSTDTDADTIDPVVVQPPPPPPPPPVEEEPEEPSAPPAFVEGTNEDGDTVLRVVGDDGRMVKSTFNFEFDKSDISSADFAALRQIAKRLSEHRDRRATISGHCDERGTREYNLALGERRAKAIADFLMSAGVRESQISVTSFGEEVPLDTASTEAAWAKNRRAVIDIR